MNEFLTANYHTHTFRCQHASGTEREYIEAAISMGEKVLGFADHVPCPYKDGYVSPIRMTWEEAPEYVERLRRLGEEYKEDIRILVGFEAEYVPEYHDEQMEFCKKYGVDYMIMGQHFWGPESHSPYSGSPTKDEERIRLYVDSVISGMKTGDFIYLAHPDLINYQGLDSVYEYEMHRLCKAMLDLNIPLEINLLGMKEGRHYPNPKFWEIVSEVGNSVILGQDAHEPSDMTNREPYEKCMAIVEKYHLPLLHEISI